MNPKNFKFSSKDGLALLGRAWIAQTHTPKAIIHLIHGLGEHSGRYDHVGNILSKAGYHLVGFDLRGHGLSKGRRGHSPSLSHLMNDIKLLIAETKQHLGSTLPRFLYGHGFGGNLAIHLGGHKSSDFKGFIVTSPTLSTFRPPSKASISLATLIAKFLPGLKINNGMEADALSRNKAIVQAYRNDVYIHHKLSVRLGLDLLQTGTLALESAQHWQFPLLLMHGSGDRITSWQASQEFAHRAEGPVEFVLWDGYYHELHNDIGSEAVIGKMVQWLNQQVL